MGQPSSEAAAESGMPLANCIKVLDGDTIRVEWLGQIEDVRILGIDCPETRRGNKLNRQVKRTQMEQDFVKNYGEIAKKVSTNWLLNQQVRLVFPDDKVERDSFGRLLAYVEQRGVDIGERLILGGNTFLWDAVHPRQETYLLFEAEAKKLKKGIWRNL